MTPPARILLRPGAREDRQGAISCHLRRACLFIDVDGTLLEFVDHPEAVRADVDLIRLLEALSEAADGAVALVSGRSIRGLDAIFAPLRLPAAGVHGFERRGTDQRIRRPPIDLSHLKQAREHLRDLTRMYPRLHLEDKGHSLALHFRRAPEAEAMARRAMKAVLASLYPQFELLRGDQVLEIKPAAYTKATAIDAFLEESPFKGRVPVYLGDDVTDMDGFEAVRRHGGLDIAVGTRVRAHWSLSDPAAVREWLMSLLASGPPAARSARSSREPLR